MSDPAASASAAFSAEPLVAAGRPRLRAEDLYHLPRHRLAEVLASGHSIEPAALAGAAYRGVSLGLPALVERLSWKTFQKTFLRDPSSGELWGWNVRVEQRGLQAPSLAKQRGGRPWTFGQYVVRPGTEYQPPRPIPAALMIDYGRGGNGRLGLMSRLRDPIVAVNPGSVELLLGWSYLDLWGWPLGTPSFFTLEREGPLTYVPARLVAARRERR